MKKILLGTSAILAAAVLSTGAQAAGFPANLSLTGSYSAYAGLGMNGSGYGKYNSFDVKTGGNVKFAYANTLSNGVAVTVNTQLNTAGDHGQTYDANSASIGTATLGTITASQTSGMSGAVNHNAGAVSSAQVGFNDSDMGKWVSDPTGLLSTDTVNTTYLNDSRANAVAYQTPSLGGATLFVGYIPSMTRGGYSNGIINNKTTLSQYQLGATFDKVVNGITVGADLEYANTMHGGSSTGITGLEQIGGGVSLGLSGFTVAGGYNRSTWSNARSSFGGSGVIGQGKATVYNLGAGYSAGAATVGLTYLHVDVTGNNSAAVGYATGSSTLGAIAAPKLDQTSLSGAYAVGTGVSLTGEVDYVKYTTGGTTANNSGFVVASGFSLSF